MNRERMKYALIIVHPLLPESSQMPKVSGLPAATQPRPPLSSLFVCPAARSATSRVYRQRGFRPGPGPSFFQGQRGRLRAAGWSVARSLALSLLSSRALLRVYSPSRLRDRRHFGCSSPLALPPCSQLASNYSASFTKPPVFSVPSCFRCEHNSVLHLRTPALFSPLEHFDDDDRTSHHWIALGYMYVRFGVCCPWQWNLRQVGGCGGTASAVLWL